MKCPNCSFDNPNNLGICKVCGETIHDAAPESVRDTVSLDFALQERFRKRAMRAREQKELQTQVSAPPVQTEQAAKPVEPNVRQAPTAAPEPEPKYEEPKRDAVWSKNITPPGTAKDFAASRRSETQARRQTEIRLKPDLNAQSQPQPRRAGSGASEYRPAPNGFGELPPDLDQTPPSGGWQPLSKNDPYYTVPLNSMLNESRQPQHSQAFTAPPPSPAPVRAVPASATPNPTRSVAASDTSAVSASDEDYRNNALAREVDALDDSFSRRTQTSNRYQKTRSNRIATFIILLLVLVLAGLIYLIARMTMGSNTPTVPPTVPTTQAPVTSEASTQPTTQPSTQPTTKPSTQPPTTQPTTSSTTKPNAENTTNPSSTTTQPTTEKPLSNFSSSAVSSGGTSMKDLTIDSLRVGSHEDFTRVVIDLDPAKSVPSYQAKISEDGRTVTLTIGGVISNKASDVQTPIGRIKSVVISQTTPDSVTAVIQLTDRMQYRVFGLESPARIVLDVANL